MRYKIIYTLIAILTFSSCKHQSADSSTTHISKKNSIQHPQTSALPFLDTSITLSGMDDIDTDHRSITKQEAEAFLYKYFTGKGVINRNDFKVTSLSGADNMCVDYDTIYGIHTNRFSGAVISYWLGPCDLNGHCFQPTKAIITITKKGYKISNEEFIPTNFIIDSTAKSDIYGYDYECGGREIIRHFKVTLRE